MNGLRIDKWLWAVRLYKTRTLAAEACRSGHVRVNGDPIKASREVRIGDTVVARTETVVRTVRVLGLLDKRVGAAAVPEFCEDLTPPEEWQRPREPALARPAWRLPGSGRPTKRDRRRLDAWVQGPPPSD